MKLFVVLGLGQFGHHVASTLASGGADVIAIDRDAKRVEALKDFVGQGVCADATDEAALRAVGVHKAQTAIIALGEADIEASILCCAAVSDLGVGQIIVRSANPLQGKILSRMGATRLVHPEREMGEQIATSLMMSGVIDQVTLSTGQSVAQVLPKPELVGKRLVEAKLRERFRINVIGILHRDTIIDDLGEEQTNEKLISVPDPDHVIAAEDVLVVVGFKAQIEAMARKD